MIRRDKNIFFFSDVIIQNFRISDEILCLSETQNSQIRHEYPTRTYTNFDVHHLISSPRSPLLQEMVILLS